ncbi:MAG: B12-binding domain-containing radical SAM protein [Magnetococcales bacterium]|nr:B12-binding domain-containing radical SAM protein [Magnetococcales bacterium]
MDILLLNPEYRTRNNYPWGILNVASHLKRVEGCDVRLIDASLDGAAAAMRQTLALLPRVDVVGVGAMSIDTPWLKTVVDTIKAEKPSCHVVVGGPHAMLCPEQTCAYPNIDSVVYGEGENATAALLRELSSERTDLLRVPGLIHKRNGELIRNPAAPPAGFCDTAYELLDARIQETFSEYIQVFAGRGCSYKCSFCFNSICGLKKEERPMPEIMEEIRVLKQTYGIKTLYFRDENFFSDKKRVLEMIRLYREGGFDFRWRALCRANYFHKNYIGEPLLRELAGIGCECLKFGFESGSERMLKAIKKGIKLQSIHTTIQAFTRVPEVSLVTNFLIGMPGETLEDYKQTLAMVEWIYDVLPSAEIVGPHYYRIYPGGELYNQIVQMGYASPDSLEGWVARYEDPDNRGLAEGFADLGLNYPWIDPRYLDIAQNAHYLAKLANKRQWREWPLYKRILMWPFYFSSRMRMRHGWFKGLMWEITLARKLEKFSIWTLLADNALYARLQGAGWYQGLKKTSGFRYMVSRVFQ